MRCLALVVVLVGAMWPALSQAQDEPVPPDAYPAPPAPAPPPQPQPQPPPPPQPQPPPPGYPPPGGYQPQPCPQPPPGYPPQPCPSGYQVQPQPYPVMMPPQQLLPNRVMQRWAVYGELLGKGLLWGIGMDVNITAWLGLGSTFSYYRLWDEWSGGVVAPYVSFYPVGGQRSSMLLQAGPQILISSNSGWYLYEANKSVAALGQVTLGYEYRHGFLFRAQLSCFFNQHGAFVWPGFVFGGAF